MRKQEAIKVLKKSLRKGSGTPFPGVEDRDALVAKAGEDLLRCVIEPVRVTVVNATYKEYEFSLFENSEVYAIAKRENHYLLYHPQKELFALAWSDETQKITMLGFATEDALAEWRG